MNTIQEGLFGDVHGYGMLNHNLLLISRNDET